MQSESKRAGAGGGDPALAPATQSTAPATSSTEPATLRALADAGAGDAGVQDPVYRVHDII